MKDIPLSVERARLKVGLTYNLKQESPQDIPDAEAEYDDYATILAIKDALEANHCEVVLLEADRDLPGRLAASTVDMVFNIAEGRYGRGREAQVPAILNYLQIPFTGSDEVTLGLALDKALTKRILAAHRIRTPRYALIRHNRQTAEATRIPCPVIIKPNAEGSGKGIAAVSVITDKAAERCHLAQSFRLYQQDMLVEAYVAGREFTVGLLGNGGDLRVFPPMEIVYRDQANPFNIYSYSIKQNFRAHVDYVCPAQVDAQINDELVNTARKIFEILGCRDLARIDFRLSAEGDLHFIEINPLPGLAPGYSDFPMLAEFSGMDYNALIGGILAAALKRSGGLEKRGLGGYHE